MSSNTTVTNYSMRLRSHTRTSQSQRIQQGSSCNEELYKGFSNVEISINLDNLSEDQRVLRNIRVAVVENQDCVNDLVTDDTVADLSESLFTNNDFQYSGDKVFQSEETPKNLTGEKDTIPSSVPDIIGGAQFVSDDIRYKSVDRNEYEESPKKRKLDEAELYSQTSTLKPTQTSTLEAKPIITSQATNDTFAVSQITKDKFTNSPAMTGTQMDDVKFNKTQELVEVLNTRATVLEALESMNLGKINRIEGNIFEDLEIQTAYMHRLDSMINKFKTDCIEGLHELEEEIKLEEIQMRQRQEMFDPRSLGCNSFPVEPKPEKPEVDDIGLEELSVIFSDMYKTLCENNFESCDY